MNTMPFIHRFETEHSKYVYDVTSNEIFQVGDIEYELADPGPVQIDIINALGQRVRSLVREAHQEVGVWTVVWDGRGDDQSRLAGGVYFCRMRERGSTHLLPMLLMR